ncbi:hypothetical protein [Blastococcus brunescens]|uniref:Uncharacterized protein n=1 Tax=Blastococcus brunescens TaxID=1564165 RepID=A0ABZ1BB55_9ACTN|nr:hypothetical protein [Blastococcus sp. BMG 8361]WRL67293.1 hypothetical protein U6N30_21195 [Blastococcus sp. BMG 8361]
MAVRAGLRPRPRRGGDTLAPAAAGSSHLWSYEVLESAGPHAGQDQQA